MKNKLLQLINWFTRRWRERITSSQDSPVFSCCLTLQQCISQSLRNTWRKVSHRFTTTGSDLAANDLDKLHLHKSLALNFVQIWKQMINDYQIDNNKDSQMSFMQTKESIRKFEEFLEKCFKTSYDASFNAEISEYAIDIADLEELSFNEAENKIQKTAEQLRQILALSKEIFNSEGLLNDLITVANFYKQITYLINDNWPYILPRFKEELRKIYYKIDEYYQALDEEVKFVTVSKTNQVIQQEINQKEVKQEDLQIELEKSFKNFFYSMQEIIEEEEITKYEIREADAAKEEAERDGYTNWRDI